MIPFAIFLVTAVPAGTYLVFNVPALWAADGGAHVARVFQIAQGGYRPMYIDHNHGVGYGGYIPVNVNDLKTLELTIVSEAPATPGQETTQKLITKQDKQEIASISNQKISKKTVLISFVNSAIETPVAYAPNVLGVVVGMKLNFNLGHTLLLAKLCGFSVFVLCTGYALFTLRRSQLKWAVMTFSLLPLVVFQATSITADSFLFSVSILFSALLIKALSANLKLTTTDKALLFICVLLIPLAKSAYFPLAFIILLVPKRHWSTQLSHRIYTLTALVISIIGFGMWTHLTSDVAASNGLVRGDNAWVYGDATLQKKFVISHPIGYLHALADSILYGSKFYMDTFFGWLGFTYLPIPGVAEVAGFLSLGLSILLAGKSKIQKHVSGIIIAILAFTALVIFTALYIYYTPLKSTDIQGVQGRYFLPLTILFIAAVAGYFPKLRIQTDGANTAKVMLVTMIVFCLVFSVFRYGVALTT